eukprot:905-Heterococcus_DN1.PRE.2
MHTVMNNYVLPCLYIANWCLYWIKSHYYISIRDVNALQCEECHEACRHMCQLLARMLSECTDAAKQQWHLCGVRVHKVITGVQRASEQAQMSQSHACMAECASIAYHWRPTHRGGIQTTHHCKQERRPSELVSVCLQCTTLTCKSYMASKRAQTNSKETFGRVYASWCSSAAVDSALHVV